MSEESPGFGPKVTEDDIAALITKADYHQFPGTTVTVCCLTLKNGYNVVGESACADPGNFDKDYGENLARKDAFNKVWALEGYLLRQRLADGELTDALDSVVNEMFGDD
jgi:hypothetical protein